ncbi:PIR Superfamily Protein [Plasmodium ovale wallikeri]|uniref:PIR Superfamily Protein n=1 Tax=Plasmodium ovale wallikeri TaxID=864142 RepID=A0A1A9AMR6_PLAOA|nr:PIR Superfamily Protein [Plasmodium ovale wallikeri]SBT57963.1 PIR Superfamily Protein [Plasmodium ovale wallikeri]
MSVPFQKYPLEALYNEFDNESNVSNYELCQSFTAKDFEFKGIHKFCNKLIRNLKNVLNNNIDNNLVKESCSYLYYWMSNELYDIVSSDSVEYETFISMLRSQWTDTYRESSNAVENCSYSSVMFYSLTDIGQFNNILNYVHNFKFVTEKINSIKPEDKESYCKYVSSFFQQYDNFISVCTADRYKNCNRLPKHPKEYNPRSLYDKLKCNELKEPKAEPASDPVLDYSDSHPKDDESSESNSFHILPIFSSLFGALLASLLTYKLTPVGSFLNKHIFNNRTHEKIYDEMNNIDLEDISEGVNINLDNDPFHITYQQV